MLQKVIRIGDAEISFHGVVRGADELGHYVISIRLSGREQEYGEFRPKWHADGNTFDIQITSVGHWAPHEAGDRIYWQHSERERGVITALIEELFRQISAERSSMPFTIKGAVYTGKILFSDGWIRIDDNAAQGGAPQ